ncbi:MAG: ATP-binding cassette domain-containing protein [Patescibacteria group bacterium]
MEKKESKKIILDKVSKIFEVGYRDEQSTLSRFISLISGRQPKKHRRVVSDISLEVEEGEMVGIIGKNGSGKSTLLRMIAGIYIPDKGTILTPKNILYINGFNHGIKLRLTMRENIYLVGSIVGVQGLVIKEVFEEIVEFSGLREFVDTKIYQFSSGMISRLNFSIFIFFSTLKKSDVLLLDEVFGAGGDIDFKQKAETKMNDLLKSGVTVMLVSHNLTDIQNHCKRVILIENGIVKVDGDVEQVLRIYKEDAKK